MICLCMSIIYIYMCIYICTHMYAHSTLLSLSTYSSHVGCMHDMYMYMYIYIYICIYTHMYQSSIGEDHSQCNIPLTVTGVE